MTTFLVRSSDAQLSGTNELILIHPIIDMLDARSLTPFPGGISAE